METCTEKSDIRQKNLAILDRLRSSLSNRENPLYERNQEEIYQVLHGLYLMTEKPTEHELDVFSGKTFERIPQYTILVASMNSKITENQINQKLTKLKIVRYIREIKILNNATEIQHNLNRLRSAPYTISIIGQIPHNIVGIGDLVSHINETPNEYPECVIAQNAKGVLSSNIGAISKALEKIQDRFK